MTLETASFLLAHIEPRLRSLLPADLYAAAWIDPSSDNLLRVFEHLRTLRYILYDYVPRQVLDARAKPGEISHQSQEGTLMFTDLAGFTPLLEANAARGEAGAATLLGILNSYFAEMIEILSKSGGDLLEFTGDALLAQFPADRGLSTARAVRAGMRMQRAMSRFGNIKPDQGDFNLGMRVGIHAGHFMSADIGTPRRMEHVLLGGAVRKTKQAEGAGVVERVCLTEETYERVKDDFDFEPGKKGYMLAVDNLTDKQLGEYELSPARRRLASTLLMDTSIEGLLSEIEEALNLVEPLASYIPSPIMNLLIESAAKREIPPDFPKPTIVFVNLIGLAESIDGSPSDDQVRVVNTYSHLMTLINAAVEARGGVLKKVTYHLSGSDMMIMFGVPTSHTDNAARAADAALAIREIIAEFPPPVVDGKEVPLNCHIGMARGPVFAAEIGEPRGRREYNVLGDTVNTAARLMGKAKDSQILMTQAVHEDILRDFDCKSLGPLSLKGKAITIPIFSLRGRSNNA